MSKKKDVSLFVQDIIKDAQVCNASDIHIDPHKKGFTIRYRVDGLLVLKDVEDAINILEIIGHIKILAGLRIDIHDRSQDGRFHFSLESEKIDIRVSIVPTYYGENVILRLLRQHSAVSINVRSLGLTEHNLSLLKNNISKTQGLLLIAGPTGSGKTTTLYSILNEIVRKEIAIVTLEDPIEYSIEGVRQIPIKPERGFTFSSALRGILRQDPDVIMVGEIRDKETAQIAIQTALTGHLVLSSIHASDCRAAILRLIEMGIEPYFVSSTLNLVISQRLVRMRSSHGGYERRTGIFEFMQLGDEARYEISTKKSISEIQNLLKKEQTKTLWDDGMEKVRSGITTEEEVQRVIYE